MYIYFRFDKLLYLGVSDDHDSQLRVLEALTRKYVSTLVLYVFWKQSKLLSQAIRQGCRFPIIYVFK